MALSYVRPMFEVAWGPTVVAISHTLDATDDEIEVFSLSLDADSVSSSRVAGD
jgi:hypothetical protein